MPLLAPLCASLLLASTAEPEVVVVTNDNTVITRSCTLRVPDGHTIADTDGNGVILVEADDIVVTFEPGGTLRGAGADTAPNLLAGVGISIANHKNVRIEGGTISGFKIGILAQHADALVIHDTRFDNNYRQHLRSTPLAEDGADWLFPHDNDQRQWVTQHGAALCIENSNNVEVARVAARRGQNGLIIDRVNDAKIFDNDLSFLSGWGLAMWRSSRNTITRNALDFCVRGHSEGKYNRGQDSAGILCFEQCNDNVIAENSVTHGGDGFFGFAGKEAIGEKPAEGIDYADAGCNRNIFVGNDFSYAPAHGLELTFSEGNIIWRNRFVENAICGIWGGYSGRTWIVDNDFERNGGMAYGLERGGINMEHAAGNIIIENRFINNRCGVHLWWDNDGALLNLPGVKAGYRAVSENIIGDNRFVMDAQNPWKDSASPRMIGTQLRDAGDGNVHDNFYAANIAAITDENSVEMDAPTRARLTLCTLPEFKPPQFEVLGETHPVGARSHLEGRDKIIMTSWGPWDFGEPFLRATGDTGDGRAFELFGVAAEDAAISCEGADVKVEPPPQGTHDPAVPVRIVVSARAGRDVAAFALGVSSKRSRWSATERGVLVRAIWRTRFLTWDSTTDPREKLDAWRALAEGAPVFELGALRAPFAHAGPLQSNMNIKTGERAKLPKDADHFGLIATTRLTLPAGKWRVRTLSDDGVRVTAGEHTLIDNWTWHGPTPNEATLTLTHEEVVPFRVEYFEIDGYAVLELSIERADN